MKSPICDMLGIEFPLVAFSHCRDVVAAVSRASETYPIPVCTTGYSMPNSSVTRVLSAGCIIVAVMPAPPGSARPSDQ